MGDRLSRNGTPLPFGGGGVGFGVGVEAELCGRPNPRARAPGIWMHELWLPYSDLSDECSEEMAAGEADAGVGVASIELEPMHEGRLPLPEGRAKSRLS